MQRVFGMVVATFAFSSLSGVPAVANTAESGSGYALNQGFRIDINTVDQGRRRIPLDVEGLLTAAHGAPPMICSLAANSVGNWGWGNWSDVPSTPLMPIAAPPHDDDDGYSDALPAPDLQRLFTGLASDDACVRELSVRLIGTQKAELVGSELVTRLGSSDAGMRTVAALGLGLAEVQSGVDPLIRALRDQSIDVRANSAWALGRLENGRALTPLTGLFRDDAEKVRLAAVAAVGRMDDSTSAIPLLIRVVQQDNSPAVRRVAAWALGHLEARDAVSALIGTLAHDADGRVREMSAWAL
ncbi:MAG TPA: HEAT repeat domain-containing protein, partial [Casimicrobiaceae bacterium]|nr:HEAT repeat domain-containing protein [Casimicrobiaceae bacterium]